MSIALLAQDDTQSDETRDSAQALVVPSANDSTTPAPTPPPQVHPAATVYSHGYEVRAKVHKYASFATLPLYATELALGQSLYNDFPNESRRGVHGAIGAGIIGLAGVNTFTGVLNLWEGRHDTNGRTLRILHSALMMASDVGFVAAWSSAPSHHSSLATFNSDKVTHRNIAIASISAGTAGYLLMLFGHH
jgi:hypothetical protein